MSQPLPSAPDVVNQDASLARGFATALVRMPQAGVVVLSASVDPGWTARVDGRPAKVFPVAPALVATSVPAGIHRVTFEFAGFSGYWVLFLLGGLSVAVLAVIDRKGERADAAVGTLPNAADARSQHETSTRTSNSSRPQARRGWSSTATIR